MGVGHSLLVDMDSFHISKRKLWPETLVTRIECPICLGHPFLIMVVLGHIFLGSNVTLRVGHLFLGIGTYGL